MLKYLDIMPISENGVMRFEMNTWWDILVGFILGCVEGLTEFAPVSSTGHMILVGSLLDFQHSPRAATFEIVIQLGSILAVVVVFWKRLLSLVGLYNPEKAAEDDTYQPGVSKRTDRYKKRLNLLHVFVACLPAIIIGLLLHKTIKEHLFGPTTVMYALVVGGIFMICAEKFRHKDPTVSLDDMTYKQAFGVGLFQCLAVVWPGFSRSGATISGGLLIGLNRQVAADFSFIISVPMMVGATGKDLIESWSTLSSNDLPLFVTGFLTAFVVALFAIKFFLALIKKINLTPFAIYRFVLAILVYFFVV